MYQRWLTAAVAASVIGYGIWIANPPNPPLSELEPADAIVLHAGGRGERFRHAMAVRQSMEDRGHNPVMVFMVGFHWAPARDLCGQSEPFEVLCPDIDTYDTIGEAERLNQLATERGWTNVIAVTTSYHLRRVLALDQRCSDITVQGSAASSPHRALGLVPRVFKEMIALPTVPFRGCR